MRKRLVTSVPVEDAGTAIEWLPLERLATVEMTSEDPGFPIEAALRAGAQSQWRAATSGPQTIRLLFDQPLSLRKISLEFDGGDGQRTQEYVLRWSAEESQPCCEIVRQQFNFSPPGAMKEREVHQVNLSAVKVLELIVTPDISGGGTRASLTHLRIA